MAWFKSLRLATQLLSAFIFVALIAGAVGLIGSININKVEERDTFLYEKCTVPVAQLGMVQKDFQLVRIAIYQAVLQPDRDESRKIAVTLFDPKILLGGLNHFMLPLWNGEGLPTPKYGNVAMEKLLERVLGIGGGRENLVAQVFGGASLLSERPGPYEIGSRNVMVAREILARHRIPVIASNVGGSSGLRLFFNTRTGAVRAERLCQVDGAGRNHSMADQGSRGG